MEGAVFRDQIGNGQIAPWFQGGKESLQQRIDIWDMVQGHAADDQVKLVVWQGFSGQVMGTGLKVGNFFFPGLLPENFQHPGRGVNSHDFFDLWAQGPGNQAGAATVFEDLHGVGEGDCLLDRFGYLAGKGDALRFLFPVRGSRIEAFYIFGGDMFWVGGHGRGFH